MNILFFEMKHGHLPTKYFRCSIDRKRFNLFPAKKHLGPKRLAYGANRIWDLDTETNTVQFVKNRDLGLMSNVDQKEFFLVQLKAEELHNETA